MVMNRKKQLIINLRLDDSNIVLGILNFIIISFEKIYKIFIYIRESKINQINLC